MATFIICHTAQKLKHLALMEIYYQLINTSLILTYNSFNHCNCYKFSGCRMKPLHRRLRGERNYCYICQLKVNYNIDKIYKIVRIFDIYNAYVLLKDDLQQCLDQGYEKFWFYNYHILGKRKFDTVYDKYLKGFIKRGYYKVVLSNP